MAKTLLLLLLWLLGSANAGAQDLRPVFDARQRERRSASLPRRTAPNSAGSLRDLNE